MDSILVFDDFKHCFRELDTSNYNDDLVVGSVFFTRDAINVIEKYYRIIGYIICDDKGVYYPIDVRKNDILFKSLLSIIGKIFFEKWTNRVHFCEEDYSPIGNNRYDYACRIFCTIK